MCVFNLLQCMLKVFIAFVFMPQERVNRTCSHAAMQACRHADMQTYRHAGMQACRHADMQTCRHLYMCA